MDKKGFDEMITHADHFNSQERAWLKAMQSKYPHSSVVSLLALLADRAFHFDTTTQYKSVALAMCDSSRLDALLGKAVASTEDASFDILNEINTFQETSFKTAPKSVILSEFLQNEISDDVMSNAAEGTTTAIDDKKSLQPDDSIATETLAVIFEKQGKIDRALAIYRKLLARNPEKSSIFAPQIQRLETLMNNK